MNFNSFYIVAFTVAYVFLVNWANVNGCKKVWDNTCKNDDECCTGNCYKKPFWSTGVCKRVKNNNVYTMHQETVHETAYKTAHKTAHRAAHKTPRRTVIKTAYEKRHGKKGQNERGACSYYKGGGITASGKPFNQYAMTAAHKTLPFNTMVRVKYQGKHIVVKITDRGPFVAGRILDLSLGAAHKLNMVKKGVVPCEVEIL